MPGQSQDVCSGERSTEPPAPWHGAGKCDATAPGAGRGWAASEHSHARGRAWHSMAVPVQGESSAWAPCHDVAQAGTGSCFMTISWLCVHGILVASGALAASLCWHCITGWEQSPTGFHRLLATGWVILEPGAAPALLAEGVGPALSRLLSALPSECLARGSGACSPPGAAPTPRRCRAGLPGSAGFGRALSHRSPALPALQGAWLAPAGIPGSAARASAAVGGSEEHHPGDGNRVIPDGNRVIPATPRCPPAWTAWLCPALQRGDIPHCLPALPPP